MARIRVRERRESFVGDTRIGKIFRTRRDSRLAPLGSVPRSLLVLTGGALIVAALYFARAILLPIALAESGDRPPDLRAERSDRALHDLVACAVVFFQP